MSTDVALVAVKVHSPAVANDVDNSDDTLFVQVDQRSGFVVPVKVARSPAAVMFASPVEHVIDEPKVQVDDPTWVPVTDVPAGSHVAADDDDDEAPASIAAATTASISTLTLLIVCSSLVAVRGPPLSAAPVIRLSARGDGLGHNPRDC
jgi:hypothetical protein